MKPMTLIVSALAALSMTNIARADNSFSLHLEPGLAIPLTTPQSNLYNPGLVLGAKGMFALTPNVAIGPSMSSLYLSRQVDNGLNAGTLWQFGGSVRLQTNRQNTNPNNVLRRLSPWVDADVSMAVTGNLVLPAFDIGLGVETPLDQNHIAWLGPFVRYSHVFQTSNTEGGAMLDQHDVNILQVGVSFSFDTPTTPKVLKVVERVSVPVSEPCTEAKLDLSEKIYFDWDSANLRWESKDKLDAVVARLNASKHKTIKVQGNASLDGQTAHNIALAARRTEAVIAYLVGHGVDRARLTAENLGVSKPSHPNTTKEGRERNRRVEFVVSFTSVEEAK